MCRKDGIGTEFQEQLLFISHLISLKHHMRDFPKRMKTDFLVYPHLKVRTAVWHSHTWNLTMKISAKVRLRQRVYSALTTE